MSCDGVAIVLVFVPAFIFILYMIQSRAHHLVAKRFSWKSGSGKQATTAPAKHISPLAIEEGPGGTSVLPPSMVRQTSMRDIGVAIMNNILAATALADEDGSAEAEEAKEKALAEAAANIDLVMNDYYDSDEDNDQ